MLEKRVHDERQVCEVCWREASRMTHRCVKGVEKHVHDETQVCELCQREVSMRRHSCVKR